MAEPKRPFGSTLAPYLTNAAHFSAPFITTFLLIHLSAPAIANVGGSSLASQTMASASCRRRVHFNDLLPASWTGILSDIVWREGLRRRANRRALLLRHRQTDPFPNAATTEEESADGDGLRASRYIPTHPLSRASPSATVSGRAHPRAWPRRVGLRVRQVRARQVARDKLDPLWRARLVYRWTSRRRFRAHMEHPICWQDGENDKTGKAGAFRGCWLRNGVARVDGALCSSERAADDLCFHDEQIRCCLPQVMGL